MRLSAFDKQQFMAILSKERDVNDREDDRCEQRVQFFITVSTSATAALIALHSLVSLGASDSRNITTLVLFVLLLYGFSTLNRINAAKINMLKHRKRQEIVNTFLIESWPAFKNFRAETVKIDEEEKRNSGLYRRSVRGSAAEFMYLSNSMIFSGLATTILVYKPNFTFTTIAVSFFYFAISLCVFYLYSKWMRSVIKE